MLSLKSLISRSKQSREAEVKSPTLRAIYDELLLLFEDALDEVEDLASVKPDPGLRIFNTWLQNAISTLTSWEIDTRANAGSLSAIQGTPLGNEVRHVLTELKAQLVNERKPQTEPMLSSTGLATLKIQDHKNNAMDEDQMAEMSNLIGVLQDLVRPIRMLHASTNREGPYQYIKQEVDKMYDQHVKPKRQASSALDNISNIWEELGAAIRVNCEQNWEGAHFITHEILLRILPEIVVERILKSFQTENQMMSHMSFLPTTCVIVLAICLYARLSPAFFRHLVENSILDHKLPLGETELQRYSHGSQGSRDVWLLERFRNSQWVFLPVRLALDRSPPQVEDSAVVPIQFDPEKDIIGQGSFGTAYNVRIHPSTHNLDTVSYSMDGIDRVVDVLLASGKIRFEKVSWCSRRRRIAPRHKCNIETNRYAQPFKFSPAIKYLGI